MRKAKPIEFGHIPQFTPWGSYGVDVEWDWIDRHLAGWSRDIKVDMDPPYQRGHVWTEAQQVAYVEYVLRGGRTGRDLLWNCPGWNVGSHVGPMELVDGKQRLTAVMRFMRDEIAVFADGALMGNKKPLRKSDFAGHMRFCNSSFKFHVNDLNTRAEVLRFYIELNWTGTPHTSEELRRVQRMLDAERDRK